MSTRNDTSKDDDDLEVGERRVELNTPVDETVSAVEDAIFVEAAECLNDGF